MTCRHCGRGVESNGVQSHYIGCRKADPVLAELAKATVVATGDQCARGDCSNPRAPQGKGPRPKFCEEHKINRKRD